MDLIQVVTNLHSVYHSNQSARYREIISRFRQEYGDNPDFFARAPGRVNIIGEHIDYSGFPVFPIAIEQDTIIAVKVTPDDDVVKVRSFAKAQYPDTEISTSPRMLEEHSFINYFIAGYRAGAQNVENPVGFQCLINGTVPIAAGLSSSASFVVACSLAALRANNQPYSAKDRLPEPLRSDIAVQYNICSEVTKAELAERTIRCERQVGTACGGMDQTISIFGEKNQGTLIEFNPIKATLVEIPQGVAFVAANSLTEVPKFVSLAHCYNKRVVECKIATILLCKHFQITEQLTTLGEVKEKVGLDTEAIVKIVEEVISEKYNTEEMERALGNTLSNTLSTIPYFDVVINKNNEYKPRQRAKHVYLEADRVLQFKKYCEEQRNPQELGQILLQSHQSCKELYECSTNELDELVDLSIQLGAYGARLTGAGWGGCMIAMVPESEAEQFAEQLQNWYQGKPLVTDDTVFITKPGRGACIIEYQESFF